MLKIGELPKSYMCIEIEFIKLFLISPEWSEAEVNDNYLKSIGMEFMAKSFKENHITGAVLLALREEHIKELGCAVLGDRILFMEYLALLKKHKRDLDRSKSLWTAQTPLNSCAYHKNCGKHLCYVACRCCYAQTEWRVTGQGIRWRKTRAAVDCSGDGEFRDYYRAVLYTKYLGWLTAKTGYEN